MMAQYVHFAHRAASPGDAVGFRRARGLGAFEPVLTDGRSRPEVDQAMERLKL
jgi:hypothetical protein